MKNKIFKFLYKTTYKRDPWISIKDIQESDRPISVGIELTNVCNAKCSFCGYGKSFLNGEDVDSRKKGKVKDNIVNKLLSLYSESGGGVFSLNTILGEPTADKRWLTFARKAREFKNINEVTLFTNAILLDNFGYENIIKSGITAINISTSIGSENAYKRIYGTDDYNRVVKNIIGLLKANNLNNNIVNITLLFRVDKPYDSLYSSNDYKKIASLIDSKKIVLLEEWDNFRGVIKTSNIPYGHKFKENIENKKEPCYALYRKLQMLYDGTIQGCSCRIEPELFCGNIMEHNSLKEAYNDTKLELIRNNWLYSDIVPECCKKCPHYIPYTSLINKGGAKEVIKLAYNKIKSVIL